VSTLLAKPLGANVTSSPDTGQRRDAIDGLFRDEAAENIG